MSSVTFENFDYTAKPEDLFKVVEIFNDEYKSIIKKVDEAKNYIYDKEELQGIGRSYLDVACGSGNGVAVVFTKWDDIVEQGYIDDDDLEIISDKIDQINDNYWDEPYNEYHELKHLKEKMIYFKRHLSLAEK